MLSIAVRALVYSNLWIGLGCAMQVALSFLLLGEVPDQNLMIMTGCATIAVYNWQRLVRVGGRVPEIHTERHKWIERHRKLLWLLTSVCAGVSLYYFVQLNAKLIIVTLFLGLIAFFYTLPWISGAKRKGLRELPGMKLILIAICWAGVTAFLPVYMMDIGITGSLIVMERFLFILAITIPFDIRDISYDDPAKRTIPQIHGEQKAKAIALIIWLASTCIMITILTLGGFVILSHVLVLGGYILTGYLISAGSRNRQELFFTGALDGTLVLIPALLWLSQSYAPII